jgi:hypothetical protein
MAGFVLDSNVYIEMKNGPYGFDTFPVFWTWIDQEAAAGTISSPRAVYEEIAKGDDELAAWFKERSTAPLFAQPRAETQAALRRVGDWVVANYEPHQAAEFLAGADPWVIAHAMAGGSVVVTHEKRTGPGAKQPKIPNVCDVFGVGAIKIYDLLRIRGFRAGG